MKELLQSYSRFKFKTNKCSKNMTAAEVKWEWKTNLTQQLQWLKWEGNRTIQVQKAWLLTWNTTQMIPVKGNSLCQVTSQHQTCIYAPPTISLCNRLPVLLKDLSSTYTSISFDPFQNQFSFLPQFKASGILLQAAEFVVISIYQHTTRRQCFPEDFWECSLW